MAAVISHRSGSALTFMARSFDGPASWRRWLTVGLLAALFAGTFGVAVYKRAEIANLVARASTVLGDSASVVGGLPLAKSLVALLDQRSPGERTKAELTKVKRSMAARPHQRALGKVRPALPAPFVKALTTPPVAALVPDTVLPVSGPLVAPLLAAPIIGTPAVVVGGGGPGGVIGGPGGGGGGPGGGGTPPAVDVPPVVAVVSPVPEPATWLSMILGFYILARAVRKQRPAKVNGAAFAA